MNADQLKALFASVIKVVVGGPTTKTRGAGLRNVLGQFVDAVWLKSDELPTYDDAPLTDRVQTVETDLDLAEQELIRLDGEVSNYAGRLADTETVANAQKQRLDTLVANAPQALDTLKEISDQLAADQTGAAAILATQQQHGTRIGALETLNNSNAIARVTSSAYLLSGSTLTGYTSLQALINAQTRALQNTPVHVTGAVSVHLITTNGIAGLCFGTLIGDEVEPATVTLAANTRLAAYAISRLSVQGAGVLEVRIANGFNRLENGYANLVELNPTGAGAILPLDDFGIGAWSNPGGVAVTVELYGNAIVPPPPYPVGVTVVNRRNVTQDQLASGGPGGISAAQLETVRTTANLSPAKAADYTLALADAGNIVPFTAAATCTIPLDVFPVGTILEIAQEGAAAVTIAAGAGVLLRTGTGAKTAGQWQSVGLRQRAANEWVLTNGVA